MPNTAKILLIDDDQKIGELLKNYFLKFNIHLHHEVNPIKTFDEILEIQPDLIILDIMMPEMDGFEVCKKIRRQFRTPIIMLSARGDVSDKIVGLELGADDYLPKPFDPRELIARVESILNRVELLEKESLTWLDFSRLKINKSNLGVYIDGEEIELTSKEYCLLLFMCENAEKIYSREEIKLAISHIDKTVSSRSVDILMSRLRQKLSPLKYLQTIWGQGYKFSIRESYE